MEYVNWDADCSFDAISVYDGPVSDDRLLSRICGNQTRVFNSTRNELTVVFTSDSTFPYKGFHASYSFVGKLRGQKRLTFDSRKSHPDTHCISVDRQTFLMFLVWEF